jgi:hypothetical protein
MQRVARLAWYVGVVLSGCGSDSNDAKQGNAPEDASGLIIVISNDSGFQLPNFVCDAAAPDGQAVEPLDGSFEGGGCVARNPNVRFQTDVLPVFRGCSGELCHAAWTYQTTVNVVATECCDQRKIIDPGRPEGSYLLQKIRGVDLCGNSSKMGNVPPEVADAIADWICLGALEN